MSYQPPQPDAHPSTDRPPALLDQVPQGGPVAPLRQDLRDVNVSTSHNPLPLPQPQPHQQPPATLSPLQQRPPPRNFGDKQSRWGPPGDRRRPHGGGGGPPPKRREEFRYPQSGEVYLRFLINSRDGGGIIGKGGQNIKRMREQYKAHVNLPDSYGAPERILTVAHNESKVVLDIMGEIIPKLEMPDRRDGTGKHEVQLLVPQDQVGSVIGRAGFRINELREKTGAFIKVFSDPMPGSTERLVNLQGALPQIIAGIQRIILILQESPARVETMYYQPGVIMDGPAPYPEYFDYDYPPPHMPPPHHHHGPDMGGPPPLPPHHHHHHHQFAPPPPPGPPLHGRAPFDDHLYRDQPPHDGPPGMPPHRKPPGGAHGMPPPMPRQAYSGFGPDFVPTGPGVTTQQVTIPNELAGAIIGRGGERIRQTRQQSNCGIKMDPSKDDLNDRIITITGTPESIVVAQRIMQTNVRAAYFLMELRQERNSNYMYVFLYACGKSPSL
ncbi:heterogeneous nuclear ribonucleoprotein K homolog [Oscarella lobularis]|uniref:heterogeneous nuclear ribonucleoprotein K homolog n=1 Tax=Oscarella lobularis TaxID=121494 RepID=UPI003313503A